MTYFAHQNFLVEAEKVEDGYVLKDHRGYTFKVTHSYFETQYKPVIRIEPKQPVKQLSPFEEQYIKQLQEFGQMDLNQEEDSEYINGLKANKPI